MACLDLLMPDSQLPPEMAGKIQTRVGDDYITPSFQKHLEGYYDLATPADQAKCLELVTAVHLGQGLTPAQPALPSFPSRIPCDIRRCKSAMAKIGGDDSDVLKAFNTTYNREYTPKLGGSTLAHRPSTCKGYGETRDKNGPMGMTLYQDEFGEKMPRPATPVRSGTSSGDRNNKPHPKEAFMTWRFPSHGRKKYVQPVPCYEALTNDKVNYIHKRLCSSTYQRDYIGIPQGFQMKSAFDLPPNWKSNVVYSLETNQRIAYQNPNQPPQLTLPSTRYGSNTNKDKASIGSIPTINRYLLDLKAKTTYDRHFNENATAVTQQIRDVSRDINIDALEKIYNTSQGNERDIVGKMLHSLKPDRFRQPRCLTATPGQTSRTGTPWRPAPPATFSTNQVLEYGTAPVSPLPNTQALVN